MRYIILGLLVTSSAFAAPPQNPDPTLAPFFQGLRQPRTNGSCCDMTDCRTVDYRMTSKGYEVFIDKKSFTNGPNAWVPVPEMSILPPQINPTGEGVACWNQISGVLCFVKASAT